MKGESTVPTGTAKPQRAFRLLAGLLRGLAGDRGRDPVRVPLLLLATVFLAGCGALPSTYDPASDAPEARTGDATAAARYASYADALAAWRGPADVNAWIGASFEYDLDRAVALSESQRANAPGPAIIEPGAFYARPRGICVDLARFAVETLRQVSPDSKARYLMIEFDPALLRGQVLRRHWVVAFDAAGGVMVMADSKRPGVVSGPYRTIEDFLQEYAAYRGRTIVSHRETDSHARKLRLRAKRSKGDS